MTSVSIIGAGGMARAIAGVALAAGADLQVVSRAPEEARAVTTELGDGIPGALGDPLAGEIVVLALPFAAATEVAAQQRDALAGRVVVDITNPVDFSTFDALVVPADSSATAVIQEAAPDARVVKAFSTTFAAALARGTLAGAPLTVLVAGDDGGGRQAVVDLANAAGLRGVDAGGLKRARELEALGFLQMTLASSGATAWDGGFALVAP
ncbi:dinucleotide-binding protein [Luteimicrobium album]|uniref:Dinucleotide-binding protein n=1 Tax=Luteimicrobium album TaxID=1054550 RepID=A0ABQ6I1Y3_9MICO|nr:NAD(P)-binding domain-containing protein [Luteimicrobium album]GMA23954.1 dinucleotide-binding protein [Luteimicrobium album]